MSTILEKVNTPDDLRRLDPKELPILAEELREMIISTVSQTGGHLASSLGVVELTIALHYVFNTPRDKLIWDVGHQSYAHKILTGRKDLFHTLRKYGGLSGFPRRKESIFDTFDVGHSSTSISAALGMAEARCLKKEHYKIIAVIGDGSLMAGMALEGLNHAGHLKKDLIVVLNDNEMAISARVGALSSYLSRLITGQTYSKFRNDMKSFFQSLGEPFYKFAKQSEEFFKGMFVPGILFEELGFRYVGPIPGHRIDYLLENFKNIKNLEGPIMVHVVTTKGKGYHLAEKDPAGFHGTGPFEVESGAPLTPKTIPSFTEIFSKTLVKLAREDPRIVAITAGMSNGTGLDKLAKEFPERFYDVGIAEQHAVTFAAGMASEGLKPVTAIYSTFLQRSYDQILHDVCHQSLPVTFVLDRAGIVGEDGSSHNGLFDLSYLRHMPNIIIMAPKDENELQHMLKTAIDASKPAAIRYPRGRGMGVPLDEEVRVLPLGKGEVLKEGENAAILAIGSTVYPALSAARELQKEGIACTVVNARFVKPLDEELILSLARQIGKILTVEENVLAGGFGSAVLELINRKSFQATKVTCLGIDDCFVEHGPQDFLRKKHGIDASGIIHAVKALLQKTELSAISS
jgi:1-deoxy-D-xylulose-5-phosphate synthase